MGRGGGGETIMEKILKRLEEIGNLEDDWDGYGTAAPQAPLIVKAAEVLNTLDNLPTANNVYNINDNEICMEWHFPDKTTYRIFIEMDEISSMLTFYSNTKKLPEGKKPVFVNNIDPKDVNSHVNNIIKQYSGCFAPPGGKE